MARCINENCKNDPMDSPNRVAWGCDFDMACNQQCYDEACKQRDHFFNNVITDDRKFASWLGVPKKWIEK